MPATRPFQIRHRARILVIALVALVLAGAYGGNVADSLISGGFEDPNEESERAIAALEQQFDQSSPQVVMIVEATGGNIDAPELDAIAATLEESLRREDLVRNVATYWNLNRVPMLRSRAGDKALVLIDLDGTEDEVLVRAGELRALYTSPDDVTGPARVTVGGLAATFDEINHVIEEDLVVAEVVAFPLTLLLLLFIFGSIVSALLPLGIGGLAIIGTFGLLKLIASVTDVSIFALNFTTAMGLGLAIDYSLLVVNRFREELAAGFDVDEAVRRTVATAGRTVMFSGATVASALLALLVFPMAFLRSFAYAGIAVVGLAVVGAYVVLPAALSVLGHRVNKGKVRNVRVGASEDGGWHRIALTVMRRPLPIATAATLFLVLLGLPFLGVNLGFPDDRVLYEGAATRQFGDAIRDDFDSREASALTVIATDLGDPSGHLDTIAEYAERLSMIDGVQRVDAPSGPYLRGFRPALDAQAEQFFATRHVTEHAVYLSVVPSVEPFSPEAEQLVAAIRGEPAPFDVLVGGQSATLVDGKASVFQRVPFAGAIIAGITFLVLFLTFGSVLMPLKAIVLNLLSLSATFGAMVWVFQDGHLAGLLNITTTGTLTLTMPVLMFCLAFGLSMDYEVFLLSRVKEEWDRTGDNELSVAHGLEHTGRIVTAAAILIAVVFASFSISRVSFMKLFGIGMTLAVLVDAFIVRSTLVPAFMKLAGGANWWAPPWMRRIHDRWGFTEHVDLDAPVGVGEDGDPPGPTPTPVQPLTQATVRQPGLGR